MTLVEIFAQKNNYIFDLDGTLVDLEKLNYEGYRQTVKESFQLELDNEEYQESFSGRRTAEGFEAFLESKDIKDYDVDELITNFRKIKRYNLKNNIGKVVTIKPSAVEFLQALKAKGFKTCLATSTTKEFTPIILSQFKLEQYFDAILSGEDVTEGKPSPQIYNLAVEKLNTTKTESVVFEDSKNGIASAKNAGIYCIGISNPGLNDGFINDADYVIQNYDEAVQALK